ncbi:MAG: hypothetical protein ACE14P_04680 [Methanotrichaceae archaeon]
MDRKCFVIAGAIIISMLLASISCGLSIAATSYSNDIIERNNTALLGSLEDLLRTESKLLSSFEYMLHETPRTVEEKISFLDSLEDLLRRQAVLFDGFQYLLKDKWCTFGLDEQESFLNSFADLLQRETLLLYNFQKNLNSSWKDFPPENRTKFLKSYEDLLRRQSNLFKGYEDLYKMKCGGLTIEKSADRAVILSGEKVTYTYVVKNYNRPLHDIIITDDKLGVIATNITLKPMEIRSFKKTVSITEDTCNTAKAIGKNQKGEIISDESNLVCVVVRTNAIPEPIQYSQYCDSQNIAGKGIVDVSTSMVDKRIALQYNNAMAGNGDIELNSEHTLSEKASKLNRTVGDKEVPLNFYEKTNVVYDGATPLVGEKQLNSREFYGGIGANVNDYFAVTSMEREATTFFASTDVASNERNGTKAKELKSISPAQLVGTDIKNSFNGTWGTDSRWHDILKKNIVAHQQFTGVFEAQKLIKMHENPGKDISTQACSGIDC